MDFNNLKNSLEEKGKSEFSQREKQVEDAIQERLGGGSKSQADGESAELTSNRDLNSGKQEIREPQPIDGNKEIEEPEDSEEISAESEKDVEAVSDDAVSSDEESEEAA